ncbi:MAG: two component transcriptional regulator, winged helix family [Clostridia bacterium]|jgi:two-component system alkaline phosphatase synthesis response regulator PhoP|nr:two component transcriptional regulator, winged helix family [Clostridia bacterium]
MNQRILVIEDEMHIQELIKYNLEKNNFVVTLADNGIEGLHQAMKGDFDLVLLDLMLPGIDGLEICKRMRGDKKTRKTPIIMLTAKSEEFDKVLGLELGADDYMTKPFSVKELIARIRAALRRVEPNEDEEIEAVNENTDVMLTYQDITLNKEKYEVRKNGEKLVLTLKEFELLKMLIENKGRVLTRDSLLDKIWGYDYAGETRTVDVHIRHLRQKIHDEDGSNQMIETIRGVGYKINDEGDR